MRSICTDVFGAYISARRDVCSSSCSGKTGDPANVVPVYFFGQNSWLFHFASWLGEPLRMATLIHEALKMRGDTVRFKIGVPISYGELEAYQSRSVLTEVLRDAVLSPGRSGASLTDS